VPQGRIAYWADWRLWGLTKEQWGSVHINNGILFLIALFFHIYYNWVILKAYFKNNRKKLRVFTREFNMSIMITLVFIFGTLTEVPPFSTVLNISDSIKDDAARFYGEPPYGHAELSSLKTFSKKLNLDLDKVISKLRSSGIKVRDEKQTLKQISEANKISPKDIYSYIKPADTGSRELPVTPPPGFGNRNLADICHEYNLNIKVVLRGLSDKGVRASETETVKGIAEKNDREPMEIFELIKDITDKR
jgi:hypothetical protein